MLLGVSVNGGGTECTSRLCEIQPASDNLALARQLVHTVVHLGLLAVHPDLAPVLLFLGAADPRRSPDLAASHPPE